MGFAVHMDRTPCLAAGSSAYAPNLRPANHNTMFSNRIGFGPRLGAAILDLVFIALILVPMFLLGIGAVLAAAMGLEATAGSEEAEVLAIIGMGAGVIAMALIVGVVRLAYSLIEALTGASPGKRVMGLQVAREDGSEGDVQLYLLR